MTLPRFESNDTHDEFIGSTVPFRLYPARYKSVQPSAGTAVAVRYHYHIMLGAVMDDGIVNATQPP